MMDLKPVPSDALSIFGFSGPVHKRWLPRRFLVLLGLLPWLLAGPVAAQFTYSSDAGEVTITGYTGSGGAVVIPGTLGGLPVRTIGPSAFGGNTNVTGVTIPDSVTSIGSSAFYDCQNLGSVVIGNGVTSIGDYAFGICDNLSSVTMGNGVTEIGFSAFIDCVNLFSVVLPDGLGTIGVFAFYNCGLQSITIPDSVAIIGDFAFSSCSNMQDATIGAGVTSIGSEAFRDCANMKTLTMGASVISIGASAFRECYSLEAITIPASLVSIGVDAFLDCAGLLEFVVDEANPNFRSIEGVLYNKAVTTILIFPRGKGGSYTPPDTIQSIGSAVFRNCEYLTELTIGDNVTFIGNTPLLGCVRLASITIGNGLTSLSAFSFPALPALTSVTIGKGVTQIGNDAFKGCSNLALVLIGSNVATIGASAFEECSKLIRITIPASVTSIGNSGFAYCFRLVSVYFYGAAPSLGYNVFSGLADAAKIYHLPGTAGWPPVGNQFGNQVTDLGPFTYTTVNGEVTITSYTGDGGVVVIPGEIIGLPVTGIGGHAFEATDPTHVIIPTSVTSIGELAFASCASLTGFTVEAGSPSFGTLDGVLCDGNLTTLVSFPTGLGGNYLVPDSIGSIVSGAFVGCASLTSFSVSGANPVYRSLDGVLFTKDLALLVAFPGGDGGIYRVPGGVSAIGAHSFHLCESVTTVAIPPSVTSIGSYAFAYCSSLTRLIFDGSAPSLDSPDTSVFLGVGAGTTIHHQLADGWSATLGGVSAVLGLFSYSINAGEVVINGYYGLEGAVNIPETLEGHPVTQIGDSALGYNDIITSITLPASITHISYGAFADAASLTDIYFMGNAPSLGYGALDGLVGVTMHYLSGTTGWESTFEGFQTQPWVLPEVTAIVAPGLTSGQFGFTVSGPGSQVVVEVANASGSFSWTPLATLTLSGGSAHFGDPRWVDHRSRFYRVRRP